MLSLRSPVKYFLVMIARKQQSASGIFIVTETLPLTSFPSFKMTSEGRKPLAEHHMACQKHYDERKYMIHHLGEFVI